MAMHLVSAMTGEEEGVVMSPAVVRVGVVGHVEWVTHARGVMPRAGEITRLDDSFEEPGGSGGVSAMQVAKLGADCLFVTALADDDAGAIAVERLESGGVKVRAARRTGTQTRAISCVGPSVDRAIVVIGEPVSPRIDDDLPWEELARCDAAYFTGHDPATLIAARRARILVVTTRRIAALVESGVRPDVVIASARDPGEAIDPHELPVVPGATVWTDGAAGGSWIGADGRSGRWQAAPLAGPAIDSYGCGDSFAAGLTVGLARGFGLDAAVALGARCGAACLTGRGGLAPQLVEPVYEGSSAGRGRQ
jgi:ribokinase